MAKKTTDRYSRRYVAMELVMGSQNTYTNHQTKRDGGFGCMCPELGLDAIKQ